MEEGITRREFLYGAAAAGTVLYVGTIIPGAAWGEEIIRIPEAERIVVTVITDNFADSSQPSYKIAQRLKRVNSPLDNAPHAEHGLSYLIETVVDDKAHACLFDFAADARGVMKNMKLLKIDLSQVEALGISHDHWDHQAAFLEIMKAGKGEFKRGLPLYVGEQFFAGTYQRQPNGKIVSLLALNRQDVDALGFLKIVEVKAPTPIIPGAYLPGRVKQVTDYEKVSRGFVAKKGDEYVQETFPGEQAVILNAKGKGLVVISSCAHRGIVNTVKHAQKMTGVEKVYLVMGGFHLTNAKPEVINKTVADIKAINPQFIVPTHCTGFDAITAFRREMPDQFILNTAGTRYVIA